MLRRDVEGERDLPTAVDNRRPWDVKCETDSDTEHPCSTSNPGLNFAVDSSDKYRRIKLPRQDPMSHRIIEKRRRDRMNNCLADLSRLIPPDYLKKGRGRIEKTEIIEMAIKHLKYLQERANCVEQRENGPISAEHFRLGYQECLSEVMRYLVEGQGLFPRDVICVQLINHLQRHCDNIMKGDVLNKPRCNPDSNSSSSGSSSNYAIHNGIVPNNIQRTKSKTIDLNNGERNNPHSDAFIDQNENKSSPNSEIDNSRLDPESIDDSPEENLNETQNLYPKQNVSPMPLNNGNYSGHMLVNNMDEGGGGGGGGTRGRTEYLRKNIPDISDNVENDCQSIQDLRIQSSYSPLSPYHYSHASHHSHCDQTLRSIRKSDNSQPIDSGLSLSSNQGDDNIHSYKFKNNIKQRFSQSQSVEYLPSSSPCDTMGNSYSRNDHLCSRRDPFNNNGKLNHKKRKVNDHPSRHSSNCYDSSQYKDQMSSSETNSSENITSVSQKSVYRAKLQESDMTNLRSTNNKEYIKLSQHIIPNTRHGKYNLSDKIKDKYTNLSGIGVPIFALHAKGSFYVPMNVDYDCLTPFLGPYDLLDVTTLQPNISLHPVTISVNFQPMFFNNKQMPSLRTKLDHKDWP